jgi:hypothetical protein
MCRFGCKLLRRLLFRGIMFFLDSELSDLIKEFVRKSVNLFSLPGDIVYGAVLPDGGGIHFLDACGRFFGDGGDILDRSMMLMAGLFDSYMNLQHVEQRSRQKQRQQHKEAQIHFRSKGRVPQCHISLRLFLFLDKV